MVARLAAGGSKRDCQRQHDGIARRHIGDGNAGLHSLRRDRDGCIGQRRTAELADIEMDDAMFDRAQACRNSVGCGQFRSVSLTVIDREAVTAKA